MAKRICKIDGCENNYWAKGLCNKHYKRVKKHGDPFLKHFNNKDAFIERFWEKVKKTDSCWLWEGYIAPTGYGQFSGKWFSSLFAHRIAYEITNGPIPEKLQIDHLCHNRSCVRPDHLQIITSKHHNARHASFRTHCPHGHEYDLLNTRYDKNGWRECRICDKIRSQRIRDNKKTF
jgi:hypothetical protein